MPLSDQLEVIRVGGVVEFYDLTPAKGITNIGSHPDNDIVLDGPGVAPFHLVIDHRRQPYHLLVLGDDAPTTVNEEAHAGQTFVPLRNWDAIELGGHTLVLLLGAGDSSGVGPTTVADEGPFGAEPRVGPTVPPAPPPAAPSATTAGPGATVGVNGPFVESGPMPRVEPGIGAAPVAAPLALLPETVGPPPPGAPGMTNGAAAQAGPLPFTPLLTPVLDHQDELILTELAERDLTAEVEQTVALQLTITNGGDLVASFNVEVEGVDPGWVVILPAQVNLNEEESGIVTITITPPRLPTSTAGRHNLSITVTCPEYPDHYSQLGATLTVNPYHEVVIGDLESKKQRVTWSNPVAENRFSVTNNGNSVAQIQVEGRDDERGVQFEFQLPHTGYTYVRQTELRLAPSQAAEITMFMEPNRRRFIGLRNRTYQFSVTATPLGGQQFPRTIGGQLVASPLIGKGIIALFLLLLLSLILVFFSPRVKRFDADPRAIAAGTPVILRWEASRFSDVKLVRVKGDAPILVTPEPVGTAEVRPNQESVYRLEASNPISRLGIRLFPVSGEVAIDVTPVVPDIQLAVSSNTITTGEEVLVSWQVRQASQATLYIDGNPVILPTTEPGEFIGSQTLTPDRDTTIEIQAHHPSQEVGVMALRRETIAVQTPTPTPLPQPGVLVFDVSPRQVTAGEPVQLTWRVQNAPSVSIDGVGAELAPEGNRQVFPQQNTTYQLRARTAGGEAFSEAVTVIVVPPPTATPLPQAPTIEFFKANPTQTVQGDNELVKLTWSVKGDVTGVTLFSPDMQISTTFTRTGSLSVRVEKSTFFVLTANNADQSSVAQVDITVLEPTPTATPEPTATATATPIPNPNIIFLGAQSGQNPPNLSEVRQVGTDEYEVVVGALLQINWSVNTATQVTLDGLGSSFISYGSRPFEGNLTIQYDGTVNEFKLTALNDPEGTGSGPSLSRSIKINAVQVTPAGPFGLTGVVNQDGQNVITWSYGAEFQQTIRGFRVYRADVPAMNFAAVAETAPTETTWTDLTAPNCSRAYFVVATYVDFRGNVLETAPSPTSWFSPACQ